MPTIGHETIWQFLTAAAQAGKGAHAYLFIGPRHIGKRHLADRLAKHLLCQSLGSGGSASLFGGGASPTSKQACEHCDSCNSLARQIHPDVIMLQREADEHTISIEQTRAFLSRLKQSPALSSRKVAIVDEAEYMTTAAANAFLKQLEEPTPSTTIIMIVHNRQRLLPTIASRCQVIEFDRVRHQPPSALPQLWQQADGLPGLYMTFSQSPSLAQQSQNEEQEIFHLLDMTPGQRFAYVDSFFSKKKIGHAEQKQAWDNRLRAWQRGLRAAATRPAPGKTPLQPQTYLILCDELETLRESLDKNINVRSHLERFCLVLGEPQKH